MEAKQYTESQIEQQQNFDNFEPVSASPPATAQLVSGTTKVSSSAKKSAMTLLLKRIYES